MPLWQKNKTTTTKNKQTKKKNNRYNRNVKSCKNLYVTHAQCFCLLLLLLFFKLFEAQIVPSLLYVAEIWGYRENKQTESVHLHACKLLINVPTVTPNGMIYGELGRYPLHIEAAAKGIQYWFRVLQEPATRYLKMVYQSLLIVLEKGHEHWVAHLESLLGKCDYGFVWLFGRVGDEKNFS